MLADGLRLGRVRPYIYEFDLLTGQRIGSVSLPNKFLIDFPSADGNKELTANISGRQANRGMEGLAISPDGTRLYGMMQSALIQDGALNYATNPPSRIGTNNRIVEINLVTGAIREFLYQLDSASNGVNEILAVNDHEFLVIERDGRAGASAAFKRSSRSTSRTRPTRPPTFEGFPSCRRRGLQLA